MTGPPIEGFTQFSFGSGGIVHAVYHSGDVHDPPLLVLPEIAGLSPGLLLFAERLIEARFQVYLPWLFGSAGERAPLRNALRLCISREFANLRAGASSPVTGWLRSLAAHVSEHNNGSCIGAIGMCLTGAFAIPLIIDPAVAAAVAGQPSVPLSPLFLALGVGSQSRLGLLNIADDEIAAARARLEAGSAHLLAVRCRPDRLSPRAKLDRLRKEFSLGLEIREYAQPQDRNCLAERPHATFTKEYRLAPNAPADHHSRQAFADLVEFFERHLRRAGQ